MTDERDANAFAVLGRGVNPFNLEAALGEGLAHPRGTELKSLTEQNLDIHQSQLVATTFGEPSGSLPQDAGSGTVPLGANSSTAGVFQSVGAPLVPAVPKEDHERALDALKQQNIANRRADHLVLEAPSPQWAHLWERNGSLWHGEESAM